MFDSTYPYYTGGIETWIYNVCERIASKYKVTIFNVENYRGDDAVGHFSNINSKIDFISIKNLCHIKMVKPFIRSYLSVFNSNVTARAMVKAFCKWNNPDERYYVIALGTVFAAKAVRLIKKKCNNVVSIVSARSLHPEVLAESYPAVRKSVLKLEHKNLIDADMIWSNGEDTQIALQKKGFDSMIIRNGIDIKKLDDTAPFDMSKLGLKDKNIVVTIGTVQKIKGYYELISAVRILKEEYNFELHLVGVGKGNLERFYHYAEKNGVRKQIHFTGEQRNVIAYAKAANLVACLSGGSGYGMAALESMLSKTPVIAWDSPVYRQLIDNGKSGILVEAWNPEALAKKIFSEWSVIEENVSMGELAHTAVQKFDWSYVIMDIEDALQKLK